MSCRPGRVSDPRTNRAARLYGQVRDAKKKLRSRYQKLTKDVGGRSCAMAVMSPGSLLALWLLSSGFRLREPSVCRAHRWVRALTRYSDGMVNVLTSLCLEKSSKLSQEVGNIRNRSSDTWFGQVLSQLPNHHHSP